MLSSTNTNLQRRIRRVQGLAFWRFVSQRQARATTVCSLAASSSTCDPSDRRPASVTRMLIRTLLSSSSLRAPTDSHREKHRLQNPNERQKSPRISRHFQPKRIQPIHDEHVSTIVAPALQNAVSALCYCVLPSWPPSPPPPSPESSWPPGGRPASPPVILVPWQPYSQTARHWNQAGERSIGKLRWWWWWWWK